MKVVVLSRKYDGRPHYEYMAEILVPSGRLICVSGPGNLVTHHAAGIQFRENGYALFLFPTDAYYNVAWDFDMTGRLGQVYCNVATPACFSDGRIEYVDLDLDVVADSGGKAVLKDRDEFEEHARLLGYPAALMEEADMAARRLMQLAGEGHPPFGFTRPVQILRHYLDDEQAARIQEAHPQVPWGGR